MNTTYTAVIKKNAHVPEVDPLFIEHFRTEPMDGISYRYVLDNLKEAFSDTRKWRIETMITETQTTVRGE